MTQYAHTVVATLGGQPQVVTFTLDLLLTRGFPISEVILVHPQASHSRLQHSLDCLNAEFVGDRYRVNGRTIHLRSHVLQLDDEPLDDIVDEVSADGALNTIHHLIRDLKHQHRCIHLSITGGRRLMSIIAIEAALLNFTHSDHIWHIYTPATLQEKARDGAIMHSSPSDDVRLIERHFVPWSTYFSELPQALTTAQETIHMQKKKMDTLEQARCEQVVRQASERQLDVLHAFAQGCTIQEVAERLSITPRTVDAHKTKLLELCREAWAMEPGTSRPGYHFLYKTFAPYFARPQQ